MGSGAWSTALGGVGRAAAGLVLAVTAVLSVTPAVNAGGAPVQHTWGYVRSLPSGIVGPATATGPCVGSGGQQCVYAVGGGSGFPNSATSVLMYSPRLGWWRALAPLLEGRSVAAGATGPCTGEPQRTCVYLIGGETKQGATADVEMFNPALNSWRSMEPLRVAVTNLAAAGASCARDPRHTCIYAISGQPNDVAGATTASVEMLNPRTGSWRLVAGLPEGATGMAAATGPCGFGASATCLYALGGRDKVGRLLNAVLRFDPRTGTWQRRASMNTARSDFGAAFSPCVPGRPALCLYAVGGSARPVPCGPAVCYGSVNTVERYDVASNRWSRAPGLNTPREELGVAAAACPRGAGGRCVYAVGGLPDTTANSLRTVEAYGAGAPQNIPEMWTYVNGMGSIRRGLGAAAAPCPLARRQTCLYAVGGAGSGDPIESAESYQPSYNRWSSIAGLPEGRVWAGTVSGPCRWNLKRTCLFVIGGLGVANALASVETYNPARNRWRGVASLPQARFFVGAAKAPCRGQLSRTCIYAVGGSGGNSVPVKTVEMYRPESNSWVAVTSLPQSRSGLVAMTAPCRGNSRAACVYALGGYGVQNKATGTVEMYDPGSNTWKRVAAMPEARYGLAASAGPCGKRAGGGTCIYAVGGIGATKGTLAVVERYNPARDRWASLPSIHSVLAQAAAVTGPCHGSTPGSCVYVLGGTTGFEQDVLYSVETYGVR